MGSKPNLPVKIEIVKAIEDLRDEGWNVVRGGVKYNAKNPLFELSLGGFNNEELKDKIDALTHHYNDHYADLYGPLEKGWDYTGALYIHGKTIPDFSFLPALPNVFRLVLYADEIKSFEGMPETPHIGKLELRKETLLRSLKGLSRLQIIALIGTNDSWGDHRLLNGLDGESQEIMHDTIEKYRAKEGERRIYTYVDDDGEERAFIRVSFSDEDEMPAFWKELEKEGFASEIYDYFNG
ncbi:MAG: hypothetical protein ACFFCS_20000, partial [Candidatus Hodarchaeota archaeon]